MATLNGPVPSTSSQRCPALRFPALGTEQLRGAGGGQGSHEVRQCGGGAGGVRGAGREGPRPGMLPLQVVDGPRAQECGQRLPDLGRAGNRPPESPQEDPGPADTLLFPRETALGF